MVNNRSDKNQIIHGLYEAVQVIITICFIEIIRINLSQLEFGAYNSGFYEKNVLMGFLLFH